MTSKKRLLCLSHLERVQEGQELTARHQRGGSGAVPGDVGLLVGRAAVIDTHHLTGETVHGNGGDGTRVRSARPAPSRVPLSDSSNTGSVGWIHGSDCSRQFLQCLPSPLPSLKTLCSRCMVVLKQSFNFMYQHIRIKWLSLINVTI